MPLLKVTDTFVLKVTDTFVWSLPVGHAVTKGSVYTVSITCVSGAASGNYAYEVRPIDPADAVLSPSRLANISTRGQVRTGNDVMIGGFVIHGRSPQTVLIRARGSSLAAAGIANPLANPVMQLFSGQAVIASNDDWGTAANAAIILSSGIAPPNAFESAIRVTLSPGAYTAIVTGANGGTGVGIIEVFAQ